MMHEIVLNGYTAHSSNSRCLHFGTAESYGIEQIHITPGADWENLLIKATFHPPSGDSVVVLLGEDGVIDVPPEATAVAAGEYNPGLIVFSGISDGVQRISADIAYTVLGHAPVDGKDSEPTPSQWEQLAAQYQSKIDKQQGAENAGKFLAVGENGEMALSEGVKPEQIASAVDAYLDENPIEAGATPEEAAQIRQNKTDIETLQKDKLSASELDSAVNSALAQAKASGEFDGKDGDSFTYDDFTEEQLESLKGKDGVDYVLTEADKQEIADKVIVDKAQIEKIVAEYLLKNPVESNVKPVEKTAEMTIPVGIDENGQLWVAPIYAPVEPGNTYSVTSILIGVESDNPSAVVAEGGSFSASLTVADGYEITKVVVTMGGVDITAEAYSNGVVSIPAVTGDVIITASAVAPTDIMSNFKWLGATTYSPGTYTAWCPTGLIYDAERDVYAHFMNVQATHCSTPSACELWFNTIDPETLEHSEPVFIARTAEMLSGNMVSSGALGCCIKDGKYYMFSRPEIGYYSSEDGGTTWEHSDYETAPDACPWGCYVLDNGRMIMGSDTLNHKVYYSDDNGKNWTIVQSSYFNEPTFIDFGGGTVMAICRENMDANQNIQKPWMHVSNDYGDTWTEAVKMETVGYMGNNNCNAYVRDGFVELFVGCRIPTNSPQYTDTLYQINQYVLDLGKGAVDDFEFVNTVYQYKNDDNPQGVTTTFTGADDFSTPCIAIKNKAHSLLMFYGTTGSTVTHHFIAVGAVPVDHFEIPSIIPTSYTASQTYGTADSKTVTVCESYGLTVEGNNPNIRDGYIKLDDITDGGFAHIRMLSQGFGDASNVSWRKPPFVSVKDGAVLSSSCWVDLGESPWPSGVTSISIVKAHASFPAVPSGESIDQYAFIKDDIWWVYWGGTWVRQDQGRVPVSTLAWKNNMDSPYLMGNHYEELTSYKTFSGGNSNFRRIAMIEYDKKSS